jgi:DNA-binding NarL/FixJ family response regulator
MCGGRLRQQIARDPMNPIRVHLGDMPRMLRTMINDLLTAEPDMTIVGNTFDGEESLPAASAECADILIAQKHPSIDDTCTGAVLSGAPAAILAVAADGHDGTTISLVRRPISLDGNGSSLAYAVRELLRRPAALGLQNQDPLEG